MKIWLTIPTYNEASNIVRLVAALFGLPLDLSIVVVDDNSPDQTAIAVKEFQKKYSNLYLIERPQKLGLGSAYRTGFKFALERGAEVVGEMDADWSHNPADVPRLVAAIKSQAEVVIGSRRIQGGRIVGWAWYRHFMSFGAMTFARIVLGLKTKDTTAGFRLYTKDALFKIPWQNVKSDGYAWQEEMIFLCERARLKIIEVPVVFADRQRGKSKLKLKDVLEFFVTVLRLRF